MKHLALPSIILGFLLLAARVCAESPRSDQAGAIESLKRLGGTVGVDETAPSKPVVSVNLRWTPACDATLAGVKKFGQLESLNLEGTEITDNGLIGLTGWPDSGR